MTLWDECIRWDICFVTICTDSPTSPELETLQVNYYETNTTVQLEWTPEIGVSHSVTVEPQEAALLAFVRSTAIQLTLLLQYQVQAQHCVYPMHAE